jgi:hypothetical protein
MSGDIEAAYSTALKLPETIYALLHTSSSITALIEWALPPIDSTHPRLIFHPAKFALVNYQPQDLTGANLLATPIPHTAWLDNAHKALKASFEDGNPPRAIADPRYKDQFLPVWVLTAWRRLSFLVTQQKKCGAVRHWLDENAETLGGLVQEVHHIFNQVLWDGEARTPIQLPALALPPEAVNAFDVPLDDSLDFAGLVLLRDIHEPAHVKKANRPRRAEPLEPDSSAALAASSSNGTGTIIEGETRKRRTLMNEIARDLHGVLRHAEALSSGPGTARLSRWMEKDTGVKTGNALNAELSAGQQANKV